MRYPRHAAVVVPALFALGAAYAGTSGPFDRFTGGLDVNQTPTVGAVLAKSYRDPARWLCHPNLPDKSNVCAANLDVTVVEASGNEVISHFNRVNYPRTDCFYVYPTTSIDPTPNSDFLADAQEIEITEAQAARYGEICQVFAPIYRQRTLPLLAANVAAGYLPPNLNLLANVSAEADAIAYADVRDAFRSYLSTHNKGRGFILIGHSQGATLLKRLIVEEIETRPELHDRMIAAHLLGSTIEVPIGADVGGTFALTPACRHSDQTGCVVAYSSYRAGDPELNAPRYGRATTPNMQALCTHPNALAGGRQLLNARLPMRLPPAYQLLLKPRGSGGPHADRLKNAFVQTAYFTTGLQIKGECVVDAAGTSYLQVKIESNKNDAIADDYAGEFYGGTGWGLHLLDVSLAQADLVHLANMQTRSWLASR